MVLQAASKAVGRTDSMNKNLDHRDISA